MRTQRPDDTSPIGYPAVDPARAHGLRDAGRRRIVGATSLSAVGGTALAVAFGALFAQSTATAAATPAPQPVADVSVTTESVTAPPAAKATPAAVAPTPAVERSAPKRATVPRTPAPASRVSTAPATPPTVVTTTDAVAPPTQNPKATTSSPATTDASSGAT